MKRKELEVGKLTVYVFDTREEMGKAAAQDAEQRINRIIDEKGEAVIVFAAAPSQNELLNELKNADIDWTKVRAMHMDEYIGLPEDHDAGFGNFLRRAIFDALPFKEIHYLTDSQAEPEEICNDYSMLLEKYPPDLVLLGVGENGHLAFNDPAVADFEDPKAVKIVELDDVCRMQQVNDGCFDTFDDVPEKAITLTMSAILSIPEAVTVVPGKTKAEAIDRMLNDGISTECPASVLRTKENAALYLDVESAAPGVSL
jgi:glucosamine-6-phosphate deaminase